MCNTDTTNQASQMFDRMTTRVIRYALDDQRDAMSMDPHCDWMQARAFSLQCIIDRLDAGDALCRDDLTQIEAALEMTLEGYSGPSDDSPFTVEDLEQALVQVRGQ